MCQNVKINNIVVNIALFRIYYICLEHFRAMFAHFWHLNERFSLQYTSGLLFKFNCAAQIILLINNDNKEYLTASQISHMDSDRQHNQFYGLNTQSNQKLRHKIKP